MVEQRRSFRRDGKPTRATRLGWLLLAGLLGLAAGCTREVAEVGRPALDFQFTSFEGEEFRLADLRGKVVVVNFWASWCPPCRSEAPYLERVWQRYQTRGVVFLGLDRMDLPENGQAFVEEFAVSYPNGTDEGLRIGDAYGVRGLPETYFIDRDGILVFRKIGPLVAPELERRLDELLAAAAP